MNAARLFAVLATLVGAAYVFVTPVLDVPDESAHYFRANALGHGAVMPKPVHGLGYSALPAGAREIVVIGGMPRHERFEAARQLTYADERVIIRYPLLFSPLPFAPAAIGCAIGDALHLRPLVTFYLGRLFTLAASIGLVLLAMRIRPDLQWISCACALMPMTLFLFASYSPDAVTIGVAFVATALALAGSAWVFAALLALALCKPAYLLIPIVALTMRRRWLLLPAVIAAGLAGASFIKTLTMRPGTDTQAQTAFVLQHPLKVAGILASDVVHHASMYLEQMIGRLGWLTISLPGAVTIAVGLMLIVVALMAGPAIARTQRTLAALIALTMLFVVEVSQFIFWTPVGAVAVEGVQGRYWIPILPMALIAISRPSPTPRWLPYAVAVVMIVANVAAFLAL